jgi:FMN-dependent NADH-azoreductase
MTKLLHIETSVRQNGSNSRALAKLFIDRWLSKNDAELTVRDVGQFPPPHLTEAFTVANHTPVESRTADMKKILALSDELIQELLDTDYVVMSVPMYNFNIPSGFKAYIDHLIRAGETFGFTEYGQFKGLVTGKKALIVSTRGAAYTPPHPLSQYDFQIPYLKTVFGFIGITDMTTVLAENLDFGTSAEKSSNLDQSIRELEELVQSW